MSQLHSLSFILIHQSTGTILHFALKFKMADRQFGCVYEVTGSWFQAKWLENYTFNILWFMTSRWFLLSNFTGLRKWGWLWCLPSFVSGQSVTRIQPNFFLFRAGAITLKNAPKNKTLFRHIFVAWSENLLAPIFVMILQHFLGYVKKNVYQNPRWQQILWV